MTAVVSFLVGLFTAIADVKVLAGYAMEFAGKIAIWYVQNVTSDTLAIIADAAAKGARAQTKEERFASTDEWQKALSRPRVSA